MSEYAYFFLGHVRKSYKFKLCMRN